MLVLVFLNALYIAMMPRVLLYIYIYIYLFSSFLEKVEALLKQVLVNQAANHDEVMDAHDAHDEHLTTLLTQDQPVSPSSAAVSGSHASEQALQAERARLEADKKRLTEEKAHQKDEIARQVQ